MARGGRVRYFTIGRDECRDLTRSSKLEWLETNGRGGFSSGTVAGANTRRYHVLLLTARKPPSERFVLVNQLEEWLDIDGQTIEYRHGPPRSTAVVWPGP